MAGMTLVGAKPILEQELYQAFYDAYMTQHDPNEVSEAGKYDSDKESAMQDMADAFSKSLSKDMAQAIYNFVMEIGIQVTDVSTVIAPSGPCSGAIPMNNFVVS